MSAPLLATRLRRGWLLARNPHCDLRFEGEAYLVKLAPNAARENVEHGEATALSDRFDNLEAVLGRVRKAREVMDAETEEGKDT